MLKKISLNTLSILVMLCACTSGFAQSIQQKVDIYGRSVIDSNGQRLEYSKDDVTSLRKPLKDASFSTKRLQGLKSNGKDTVALKSNYLFPIFGTSIGKKSMNTVDINHDGVIDLICAASLSTFGAGDYWYIVNYDASKEEYKQVWTSNEFPDRIEVLEVIDPKSNGEYVIAMGLENGTVVLYDANTKALLQKKNLDWDAITSIVFGDADNDGIEEIVASSSNNIYILNKESLDIEFTINTGSDNIVLGNVDATPQLEIVTSSGSIYTLENEVLSTGWKYYDRDGGIVKLSDIDGDGKDEIILAASWQYIYVYNADVQTTKYVYEADLDIDELILYDVNNDGIDEIIYGDGQWGSVYCLNAVTRALIWEIDNPEHGVAAISIADIDNDRRRELIWTAGWTSTGEDHMYVHDLNLDHLDWQSQDITGPFYAVATGDVDNDLVQDIVAVSYESNSGYDAGVIVVIDSETKEVKWQCDPSFLGNVWTGVFDVDINDIDNDGLNEIIIAAGETYDGRMWIINGKTKTIESTYEFPYQMDIEELHTLEVVDIDNDGAKEIITANSDGVYCVNPVNWELKWSVLTGNSYTRPNLRCVDFNGDDKKEIIVSNKNIYIIYDDQSYWKSPQSNYVYIDTIDYNHDGVLDILATTTSGTIEVIDIESRSVIFQQQVESSDITSVIAYPVKNDFIFVYSYEGRLNFYRTGKETVVGQFFARKVGAMESLKFINYADSVNLLVGTSIGVMEIPFTPIVKAITSIKENNNSYSFECYPNPTSEFLMLQGVNIQNKQIEVFNVSGQKVIVEKIFRDNSFVLDTRLLAPGTYILKVGDTSRIIVKY